MVRRQLLHAFEFARTGEMKDGKGRGGFEEGLFYLRLQMSFFDPNILDWGRDDELRGRTPRGE